MKIYSAFYLKLLLWLTGLANTKIAISSDGGGDGQEND